MATPNIPDWTATTSYVAGNHFMNAGKFYKVLTGYTSGGTFGATDLANITDQVDVQTWMTFDEWRQVSNQASQKSFSVEQQLTEVQGFAVAMSIALGS